MDRQGVGGCRKPLRHRRAQPQERKSGRGRLVRGELGELELGISDPGGLPLGEISATACVTKHRGGPGREQTSR